MNITDQIITAANSICNYWMAEKARQTSSIIKKKRLKDIYSEWYDEISKEVYESEYASDLLIRDILVYNSYESIAGFLSLCFYQVNTLAEIVFRENTTVDYEYEYDKIPIVRKKYDFSRDNVDGLKATSYLSNLFLLREIRRKLGYDVNLYPEKCYVIAFKFEDVVYVWENGRSRNMRLTIDRSANQEILDVFFEIFYTQTKTYEAIYSLLDDLPFVVGEDAQKEFDVIWYRYKKQTPLTYRCFPNTHTVDFSFTRKICRHKGEYCIEQEKLDSRYNRFIDLYEALDKDEKEILLINTIDYLERFIETDCFDKPMHKNMYFVLLCDVKSLTAEYIEMGKTMRTCISNALNRNKENGGPLFSIPGLSHLDGWEPKMPFFNSGDEDSQSETHKPQQFGPNWDLINAGIEETREENKMQQIEIIKTAYIEAMKEMNNISSNKSQQEENVPSNAITDTTKDLEIKIETDEDGVDATVFMGFMNGSNEWNGGRIMNEVDYYRLLEYTTELIEHCRLPLNIKPIPKINLTKQEIIYTYSIIHDHFYPNGKLRKEFFIFLDKVFSQLYQPDIQIDKNNNYLKSYSYKKFRVKPPHYHEYYI